MQSLAKGGLFADANRIQSPSQNLNLLDVTFPRAHPEPLQTSRRDHSKSKSLFPLALLASASILPLAAHADTVDDFLLTGHGNTITFSLPVPPQGGAVNADDFRVPSLLIDFNGHTAGASLDLFTSTVGGGFDLTYFFPGGQSQVAAEGAQLFSGTTSAPTILPDTYLLEDRAGGTDTLTITQQPPPASPVPEPSTLLLLATGALGLITAGGRRRSVRESQNLTDSR
ncbi:PEP-CTERM sorting domain-containing protein [Tunturiibacter lichenicola]|uniref:PEP-CTERM sorting domain-containing protein n=1 Tax=Tunturiibacter lichenicola TaxID=2051959 RepID=UPI0021B3F114|nr:PEP-CTERM sorting domain-containing protein [Edaphobacter lichenicola]